MHSETIIYERKKVYDPILRILHALIGLSIVALIATAIGGENLEKGAAEKTAWMFHIYSGYVLGGALVGRLLWGIVGPRSASLKELWHPKAWLTFLKTRKRAEAGFGHDPYASMAYLAFYAMAVVITLTGLALAGAEHGTGPFAASLLDIPWVEELAEEPHELLAFLIGGFILVHIGAIIWHERSEKRPLAQAMVTGYQYRLPTDQANEKPADKTDGRPANHRKALPVVLAALFLLPAGANAATPDELLAGYAAQAKQADATFTAFSAERGRSFYGAISQTPDGPMACASCHGAKPTEVGKTSAGKVIDPLAGNPERFTDTKKVEKWFRRNCNDVLQRACTAREKGDFIAYVIQAK